MKRDYDVVIAGAGINGLACGCYLAKAGLEVAVIEKRNECGPFALTEDIFGAGVPVDTHAGVCFLPGSPVWGDLDLSRFGFAIILPEVTTAALWPDRNLVHYRRNRQKNIEAITKFSQRDAKTFQHVASKVGSRSLEIAERVIFAPPSLQGEDYLFSLGCDLGFDTRDLRTMNAMEFLELLYENEYVRTGILSLANARGFGDLSEKGEGVIQILLLWAFGMGITKGGMHNLVHALVRCYRHHGGTLLLNAPVAKVSWGAGKPDGVILAEESVYGPLEIKARQAVVMHTSPLVALAQLSEDQVAGHDAELHRKMKNWDMSGHNGFVSCFLLKESLRWGSASWNPDIQRCPYPMIAWRSWDHAAHCLQYAKNEDLLEVLADVGEVFHPSLVDPSRRSSDGSYSLVFEIEYPVHLRRYGGIEAWDNRELTDRIQESHIAQIERLAPGFRDHILADTYMTPLDNWRRNPSAIYGHEAAGDTCGKQWYAGRMPHRSRIPGLYFSGGVWPPSATYLAGGYIAACCVAEDLGVRKQEWWCHRPFDQVSSRVE